MIRQERKERRKEKMGGGLRVLGQGCAEGVGEEDVGYAFSFSSIISRTVKERVRGVKGFFKKWIPSCSMPRLRMASLE